MNRTINIPNRLGWIDWAKVFAISCVVFGHIPQVPGSFPQFYIVTFHMPLFFFISGFLTKKEYLNKDTLAKYWHTLIVPYFLYNLLFYPYWVIRHYIEVSNGEWYDYIKPIIGTFMLQCDSAYYEPLNGVTWFVASLLGFKLILSVCNRLKYGYMLILMFVVISTALYVHNQFYLYIKDLTPVGFFKCFPFYFLGYYCRYKKIISISTHAYDWIIGLLGICMSIIVYYWERNADNMLMYGIRFWVVSLFAILGVIGLCKMLNNIHLKVIDNLSIGTIVIMGFHFILIGMLNFLLENTFDIHGRITYPWFVACLLVLFIEVVIYPIIICFANKYPFLLGKRSIQML